MSDLTASGGLRRPRTRWGWFVALGIAQLVLGVIAWFDVIAFTIAGVIFIGALLVVAGAFQVVHAFMDREWGAFVLHLLVGILYVIGGLLLMDEPLEGSVIITILVAVSLIIGGIMRIVIGVRHRHMPGWWLIVVSGVISLLVGLMLYCDVAVVGPVGGRHADRRGTDRSRRVVDPVRADVAEDSVAFKALAAGRNPILKVLGSKRPALGGVQRRSLWWVWGKTPCYPEFSPRRVSA